MRPKKLSPKEQYITNIFAHEDEFLQQIAVATGESLLPININPLEGKLIQVLLKMTKAVKVVEIGTLAGYSAIWIARALPIEGKLYSIERDPTRLQFARSNIAKSDVAEKITLCSGDATIILDNIAQYSPFDAIFIDGNKPAYLKYLEWAEQNIRIGGLIIADNTLLSGAVYDHTANLRVKPSTIRIMQEFNLRLSDPAKYCSILVPTEEGLTVALKLA
jgi:predicted O-methyltransferase YrrM